MRPKIELRRDELNLRPNYIALQLTIDYNLDPEKAIDALMQQFPIQRKLKTGPKTRPESELIKIKKLRESGMSYSEIAETYGFKSGNAVYQALIHAGIRPQIASRNDGIGGITCTT